MTRLTEDEIRALEPESLRYDVNLEDDFVISVLPNGIKTWAFLYEHEGRPRRKTLGIYPDMSLAQADEALMHARGMAERLGGDLDSPPAPASNAKSGESGEARPAILASSHRRNVKPPPKRRLPWGSIVAGLAVIGLLAAALMWFLNRPETEAPASAPAPAPATDSATTSTGPQDTTSAGNPFAESAQTDEQDATGGGEDGEPAAGEVAPGEPGDGEGEASGADEDESASDDPAPTAEEETADAVDVVLETEEDGAASPDGAAPEAAQDEIANAKDAAPAAAEDNTALADDAAPDATPAQDTEAASANGASQPPLSEPAAVVRVQDESSEPPDEPPTQNSPAAPDASAAPTTSEATAVGGRVARAIMTSEVSDLEPVDDLGDRIALGNDGMRSVYFFTELRQFSDGKVVHRWEHNGRVLADVALNVKQSWRWRTYSSKDLLPNLVGDWTVSVIDGRGEVLASRSFVFVDEAQGDQAASADAP